MSVDSFWYLPQEIKTKIDYQLMPQNWKKVIIAKLNKLNKIFVSILVLSILIHPLFLLPSPQNSTFFKQYVQLSQIQEVVDITQTSK